MIARFVRLMPLFALVAACTPLSQPVPAEGAPGTLKVASWNLEHLAARDGTGCQPRTEADYAELRRHAEALGADVIAFQEVENRAAAERVFAARDYDVVMSTRPASGRASECRGLPGSTIGTQAVGFAIRKGVPWTRNADLSALGLGDPNLRWGVDVTIGAATPIRLLALHLKSGCNIGRARADRDCDVLFDQLPVLEGWIDDRAREGTVFVVLGDWNRRIASSGDLFFREIDDGEPVGAELTIAAGERAARCKARYREFIDHIVTGAKATALVEPGSFEEYRYGVSEDRHPSDHCPVSVRFELGGE